MRDSVNRGFNLMVTAVLTFAGIAFGAISFNPVENDWGDRLDDVGLLAIGLASLAWYLIGRNRFRRSLAPIVFAGLALAIQIVAIPLEHDDPSAFGDNIGGLLMLAPFFVFAVVQYVWNGGLVVQGAEPAMAGGRSTSET